VQSGLVEKLPVYIGLPILQDVHWGISLPTWFEALAAQMSFVVFLCMTFAGGPELTQCEPQTRVMHDTADGCRDEIHALRTWWVGQPGRSSLEGDGRLPSGLKWHREFQCYARPTWNPVD
jgi:hypothetical protein